MPRKPEHAPAQRELRRPAKPNRVSEDKSADQTSLLQLIESGERFELLCADLLLELGCKIVRAPNRGADRGLDILATLSRTDELGFDVDVRMAVECKHYARGGRSVTEAAAGNIVERTLSHNCNRYLLITSTIASASLAHQIEGINANPSIPLRAHIWNGTYLEGLLQRFPKLKDRYLSHPEPPAVELKAEPRFLVVHLHPDFQDELIELLQRWNEVQPTIKFITLKVPREIETKLLVDRPLSKDKSAAIARALRQQAGFQAEDGIVQFCEGRLYSENAYQLFATFFLGGPNRHVSESTISIRIMRKLVEDGNIPNAPVFALIVRQLLSILGHDAGLENHYDARACSMDYCNDMAEIRLSLRAGPKYCPDCEKKVRKDNLGYLIEIATAATGLMSKGKDRLVDKRMRLREERTPTKAEIAYDVALSFADEDRKKAESLARALKRRGLRVFYDDFEKSRLWGEDLYAYLSDLYRYRATYCVMLLSQHYERKLWTSHELRAAQERAFRDNRTYILPIRIDDTEIPGILSTVGYLRWDEEIPESIVDLVEQKLAAANTRNR